RAIALDVYQTLIPPPMPIDPKKEFPVRKGFRELMERCRERDVKVAITSDMPLEIVLEDLRDYGINQEQFYMFRRLNQCPKDFSLIIKECEIKPWELFVIGDCIWKDMEGAARYGARGFQVPKYDFRDDSFDLNSIVF
ncbi:MAG: HAD family hydrolase, partial [archaeon]